MLRVIQDKLRNLPINAEASFLLVGASCYFSTEDKEQAAEVKHLTITSVLDFHQTLQS